MIQGSNSRKWTEVITPKNKISIIDVKQLIQYKDLIFLFVKRDFITLYKQTILGPFWYLIQPIMQTAIFAIMFGNLFSISEETGIPSVIFYLSGNVSWIYFSQSVIKISNTFSTNAYIFGKVYFPRLVAPISIIISNLIGFAIQFLLFISFYLFYVITGKVSPNISISSFILIPFLILNLSILGLGIGLLISSLTTKYKDFKQFIGFGVQLLMYMSPVIVPMSIILKRFPKWTIPFLEYNPMTPIIEGFRVAFFNQYNYDLNKLIYSISIAIAIFIFGTILFNKTEQNFIDTV